MQVLFEESAEDGGCGGLGVIPGVVGRFDEATGIQVPHIGWNNINQRRRSGLLGDVGDGDRMYFVHSYRAVPDARNEDYVLATCEYGGEFVAAVNKGNVYATQVRSMMMTIVVVVISAIRMAEIVPIRSDGDFRSLWFLSFFLCFFVSLFPHPSYALARSPYANWGTVPSGKIGRSWSERDRCLPLRQDGALDRARVDRRPKGVVEARHRLSGRPRERPG